MPLLQLTIACGGCSCTIWGTYERCCLKQQLFLHIINNRIKLLYGLAFLLIESKYTLTSKTVYRIILQLHSKMFYNCARWIRRFCLHLEDTSVWWNWKHCKYCFTMNISPDWQPIKRIVRHASTTWQNLKCTCTQNIFFAMWKGHRLEVHCTNIQLKIFIK